MDPCFPVNAISGFDCAPGCERSKPRDNSLLAHLSLLPAPVSDAGGQWLVLALGLCLLAGCASTTAHAVGPGRAHPTARTIGIPRTVITKDTEVGIDELFARARADFDGGRYAEAARQLDRVVELDPDGPFAKEALFDAGAAHDLLGDLDIAAARYLEVARRHSGDPLSREALVRAVRLLAHREQWKAAGEAADVLLASGTELPPLARVVAYSGKALSLVLAEDLDGATHYIAKGRDVVDTERLDVAGAIPRDLAQLYFALGEVRRLRSEAIHLVPVPGNFSEVLEQRCQLLLDAQSAYSDTMRAYDAHWSTMAGYRVGELYQRLHAELMRIPVPSTAPSGSAKLFEGAMRLRYSVLLRKGLAMMEHTIAMADRTGERSEWVTRAAEARRSLEDAVRQEDAALAALPYSRLDLEKALAQLAHRSTRSH